MSIEDVAERADVWARAIKKIVKAVAAAAVALAAAIGGLLMWWPFGAVESPVDDSFLDGTGYGPQCSQLYNTIDHTWTEQQWVVWESLRRDLGC